MSNAKYIIFLFLAISSCQAQDEKLLVQKALVSDLSTYPIYPSLVEEVDGQEVWKKQYKYLDSIEIYRITYISDGLKVTGLLIKPKADKIFPSIIYNRGGNREFGSLKVATGALRLGKLANQGYVVIASQYRGNGGSEGQEEFGGSDVNDVVILTEVLKEVDGANSEAIGMYGWSRGGMMTYIALTKTNKIKAAIVGGAISDLKEIDRPEMETGVYAQLIPNYDKNKANELKKRSAIDWVDKFPKNVPILLLHGTSDWRVKPKNSLQLALKFDEQRIPYRLVMFEGGNHGISEHRDEVDQQVVNWFDRFLKKGERLPDMKYHGK